MDEVSTEAPIETPETPEIREIDKKEKKTKIINPPEPTKYKLNVYAPSGNVRHSISSSVYQDMAVRYGDIMRSISSTRWMTMDEICESVWQMERKMRYPANRTRKAIEDAVADLVERSMMITI